MTRLYKVNFIHHREYPGYATIQVEEFGMSQYITASYKKSRDLVIGSLVSLRTYGTKTTSKGVSSKMMEVVRTFPEPIAYGSMSNHMTPNFLAKRQSKNEEMYNDYFFCDGAVRPLKKYKDEVTSKSPLSKRVKFIDAPDNCVGPHAHCMCHNCTHDRLEKDYEKNKFKYFEGNPCKICLKPCIGSKCNPSCVTPQTKIKPNYSFLDKLPIHRQIPGSRL